MLPRVQWQGIKPSVGARVNPAHPLNRGLLHWWPFWEGSGSSAIYDIWGGRPFVLNNMEATDWGDGALGKFLEFGGTNESGSITSITGLGPACTMVIRFRLTGTGIGQTLLAWNASADNNGIRLEINSATNRLFLVFGGVAGYDLTGFSGLATGQDYELVISCTGNGGAVYAALKRGPGANIEFSGPHSVGTIAGTPNTLTIGDGGWYIPQFSQSVWYDLQLFSRPFSVNEQIDAIIHPYGQLNNPRIIIGPPRGYGKLSGGGPPASTRGTPFGHRGTAFNGGRTFHGIIQ